MKKTKVLISCLLAMVMIALSAVPAFAADDKDVDHEAYRVDMYAYDCELEYINYFVPLVMNAEVPLWSDESRNNMSNVIAKVHKEIGSCKTIEEVNEYRAMLDDAVDKMCVSSTELQFMLDLMEIDYTSTGYYDDETYAKLKSVYESAQTALESGIDREIHLAYVAMRNEFDDLCVYNTVPYDVSNDGKFNIKDCAIMQLNIAELQPFTSSQYFISLYREDNKSIEMVAEAQLILAGLNQIILPYAEERIERILKYKETYGGLDPDLKHYTGLPENGGPEKVNYMYHVLRYPNHDLH